MNNDKQPQKKLAWFSPKSGRLVGAMKQANRFVNEIWFRLNNLARVNYELGCTQVAKGNIVDAIFRFRFTLWLDPKHTMAWYNLGCCYLSRDQTDKAIEAFKKSLALKVTDETRFMLASIDPRQLSRDQLPALMPLTLLKNHFDMLAGGYDALYMERLGYKGPELVSSTLSGFLDKERQDYQLLDLGCGTGLCAVPLRPYFARSVGVDLSPRMLAAAKARKQAEGREIYDALIEQEIVAYLSEQKEPNFDVVLLGRTLDYTGDLEVIFAGIHGALKSGGLLVFTSENAPQGDYYLLPKVGRFAHNGDYLARLAQKYGFSVAQLDEVQLYTSQKGLLGVFRRA